MQRENLRELKAQSGPHYAHWARRLFVESHKAVRALDDVRDAGQA